MSALIGALAVDMPTIVLSGALSATGGGASVIGTSRTVTVQAGSSGTIRFEALDVESGTPQYKKNAASFATITEALEVTFSNADTLQLQGLTMTAGTSIFLNVIDKGSGRLIEAVTIQRT